MRISTFVDRARGFIRHAKTHNERGNQPAVDEAIDDLARLVEQFAQQHPDAPERRK